MANRYVPPKAGSRHLWELEVDTKGHERPRNDPERDEVCKGLSLADQIALMDQYGDPWPTREIA